VGHSDVRRLSAAATTFTDREVKMKENTTLADLQKYLEACGNPFVLFDAQKADDSDLIARSLARNPPRKAQR
jgi:hypothetical protein